MPIDLKRATTECQDEFALKIAQLVKQFPELNFAKFEYKIQQICSGPKANLWWQMATQSLEVLLGWLNQVSQRTEHIEITARDIFMAYLKTSILYREKTLPSEGNCAESTNLHISSTVFLAGLADIMTRTKILSVQYPFPSQEIPKNMEWAARFFDCPSPSPEDKKLTALQKIHVLIQDILFYQDGHWRFVDEKFKGCLDSIQVEMIHHLVYEKRKGLSHTQAQSSACKKFATLLFTHNEGHMFYYNRPISKDTDASILPPEMKTSPDKASTPKSATSMNTASDDDMPSLDDSPTQANNAPSFSKTTQQPSASMLARSMAAVINPLGVAAQLTHSELEQLPYEEFLELSKEQQETLIRSIHIDRSADPDDSYNGFLDDLNKLLKLGVSLTQFAQLTYRKQRAFMNDQFIYLSLKNGISFEKLATLDYSKIRSVMNYFSSNNRLLPLTDVYREILGKENNDPEIIKSRSRVVEAINQ